MIRPTRAGFYSCGARSRPHPKTLCRIDNKQLRLSLFQSEAQANDLFRRILKRLVQGFTGSRRRYVEIPKSMVRASRGKVLAVEIKQRVVLAVSALICFVAKLVFQVNRRCAWLRG